MTEFLNALSQIHPVLVCLFVMLAKVIEISIQSLKTCLLVKGQKIQAAGLGFVECMIWGLAISTIISTLGDDILLLVFYCFGYASGLYIGSVLESRLAFGTSNIELIANEENTKIIIKYLKKHNKGFTILDGYGATEKMHMIYIVLPRKEVQRTIKELQQLCDHVFFVTSDVSKYAGGYGVMK